MPDIVNISRDDLPELARRFQAAFPSALMTEQNLQRKIWGDPDYAPDLNLIVRRGPRIDAALLGVMRDKVAFVKIITPADPAAMQTLYDEFESRVRARKAERIDASGSAPNYIFPGIDPRYTDLVVFFQNNGFAKSAEVFNMTALPGKFDPPLQEAERRLADVGYRLARLRPEDVPEYRRFMLSCFSQGWLTESLTGLENDPVTVHVAWREGRIAAFAAAEVTNPGWFGPMGTDPAHRGHGLGRVLLWRCLRDLRHLGYREVDIAWVGPLSFYAQWCGATVSRVFWMFRKPLET